MQISLLILIIACISSGCVGFALCAILTAGKISDLNDKLYEKYLNN